jgi:hypothetical protein
MNDDEIAAWVDAAARGLGLSVSAEQRAGVLANFKRLAAMAALVNAAEFDETIEPAPVFRHD